MQLARIDIKKFLPEAGSYMHRLKRGEPLSGSHSYWRWGLTLFSVYLFLGGCGSVQSLNPSARKPAGIAEPTTWVLIKNPRFGAVEGVESLPEHIWVQEDQVPWTLNRSSSAVETVSY